MTTRTGNWEKGIFFRKGPSLEPPVLLEFDDRPLHFPHTSSSRCTKAMLMSSGELHDSPKPGHGGA